MDISLLVLCVLLGLALSWLSIRLILRSRLAGNASFDHQHFHHIHKTPVSRLGGVAFAVAFVAVAIIAITFFPVDAERAKIRWVFILSSLAMFSLGLLDDLRPLGAKKKLLCQLLIAIAACQCGIRMDKFQAPFGYGTFDIGWWGYLFSVLWLVGLTNLINLIDGIDGLAGGVALMLMGLLTYAGIGGDLMFPLLSTATLCGALMAFLRFNFPPARIYMGDGGAYFLGYLIAALSLLYSQKGTMMAALIAPIFALAVPMLDVCMAIARRGLRGLPIFRADRKHIHHRLLNLGFSHRRVVLILYAVSAVFLLMAFAVFWSQGRLVPVLTGCAFLVLLLSARSFNFSRDWFGVTHVMGHCLEARKLTQSALLLGDWLEVEAERCESVECLWKDFQFIVSKLGFVRVTLTLPIGQRVWESPAAEVAGPLFLAVQELNGGMHTKIVFEIQQNQMSSQSAHHLSEIAAECWFKAAQRWQRCNNLPIAFGSHWARTQPPSPASPSLSLDRTSPSPAT